MVMLPIPKKKKRENLSIESTNKNHQIQVQLDGKNLGVAPRTSCSEKKHDRKAPWFLRLSRGRETRSKQTTGKKMARPTKNDEENAVKL